MPAVRISRAKSAGLRTGQWRLVPCTLALAGLAALSAATVAPVRAAAPEPTRRVAALQPIQETGQTTCRPGDLVVGGLAPASAYPICALAATSAAQPAAPYGSDAQPREAAATQATASSLWRETVPSTPRGRYNALMTRDLSGRPLLFGGCCWTYGDFNDTWRGDVGRWKRLNRATTSGSGLYPPGREAASMAFDAARGQVVLFGGLDGAKLLGDTWTWNGTTWTQRHPATSPTPRLFATMGYNPKTRQVVLFGGDDADGSSANDDDTWTWDGVNWTQQHPDASPPPRIAATMADDAGGNTVLFGGESCYAAACTTPSDTWTWDGTGWTLRVSPLSPTGRVQATITTDRARNRVVLFGGANQTQGQLSDTWTWDGSAWSRQLLAGSPPARQGAGMAYDATTRRVALFGGYERCFCDGTGDDTWTWDGSTWTEVRRSWPWATVPTGTYDAARQEGVLFTLGPPRCSNDPGGTVCRGHTWTWNGSFWTDHATGSSPLVAGYPAMAFDAARASVVLFGGQVFPLPDSGSIDSQETWTWDGSAWTKRDPMSSPPARRQAPMAFDARNKKVVLFGGASVSRGQPAVLRNDTWTWDGTNWRKERPSHSPAPRVGAAMTYDAATGEVVLFGGNGSCPNGVCATFNDTWTWNGRDWTRRQPASSPSPRSYAALGYDIPSGTAVLFGGWVTVSGRFPTFYNDTWSWNGSTWTRRAAGSSTPLLSVPGRPSGRFQVAVMADRLGRVVLFGGGEYGRVVNDMWTYGG